MNGLSFNVGDDYCVVVITPASLILLTLCLFSAQSHGQVSYYQCEDDTGRPIFSQRPCSETAPVKELRVQQKISGPITDQSERGGLQNTPDAPSERASPAEKWNKVAASNRKREVERELKRSERKIKDFENQRDKEIAALNRDQERAANNYAGAQWETALATEMNAVNTLYDTKIRVEERKLERLEEELGELGEILAQ